MASVSAGCPGGQGWTATLWPSPESYTSSMQAWSHCPRKALRQDGFVWRAPSIPNPSSRSHTRGRGQGRTQTPELHSKWMAAQGQAVLPGLGDSGPKWVASQGSHKLHVYSRPHRFSPGETSKNYRGDVVGPEPHLHWLHWLEELETSGMES